MAEKAVPETPQGRDLLGLARFRDGAFDERRGTVVDKLARNAVCRWANAGHRAERIRLDQRGDMPVEA